MQPENKVLGRGFGPRGLPYLLRAAEEEVKHLVSLCSPTADLRKVEVAGHPNFINRALQAHVRRARGGPA